MTEEITLSNDYVVKHKRYNATDPRLGRHVRHDSRSLQYKVVPEKVETLKSVHHTRYIPTLDQGDLGSCTGNASTGALGSGLFWASKHVQSVLSTTDAAVDEAYAIDIYSDATKLDSYSGTYPPTDTGSDGLSVAKVLKARGHISGYQHATSLSAVLTALSKQPVIVGTVWLTNMFNPDADGRLRVVGNEEGGHEYVLDELDVEKQIVWMHNSWGDSWGVDGRAYLTWSDLEKLLKNDGDCTVFTPVTQPAPTPTPVPPTPTPTPVPPAPQPTPVPDDPKAEFIAAAKAFMAALTRFLSWLS